MVERAPDVARVDVHPRRKTARPVVRSRGARDWWSRLRRRGARLRASRAVVRRAYAGTEDERTSETRSGEMIERFRRDPGLSFLALALVLAAALYAATLSRGLVNYDDP